LPFAQKPLIIAPVKPFQYFGAACLFVFSACDSKGDTSMSEASSVDASSDSGTDATPSDSSPVTDALPTACNPKISNYPLLPGLHIAPDRYTPANYNSNPPSSGEHCGIWGEYTTFVNPPLPRCNYIHNLEHGAIVLLHNCPGGCSDVTTAFSSLVKGFKGDAVCKPARFVITPDSALANKVAAVAWGWTFTADCLDANATAMLSQFVQAHYGNGPEAVCSSGGIGP
jgi:hypothetical protein